MSSSVLYIGNKRYSSWSFRAWLGLEAAGFAFEESLQPFDDESGNAHFRVFSPTGKVPVLVDDDVTIWESLAILEYAADKHPELGLWPAERVQRGLARCVSNEMHAEFGDLRSNCPMNFQREPTAIAVHDGLARDVRRIEAIWADCLERSGGPFLFGPFGIADAMFAPVVNRLRVYALSESADVARYSAAMTGLAAWQKWDAAAQEEIWRIEEYEQI